MAQRIACTALLRRIVIGTPNKSGDGFIGQTRDVTSDCLKAVIDKVGVGNTVTVHENGLPKFEIEVRYASERREREQL